jgi:hypothetical protein
MIGKSLDYQALGAAGAFSSGRRALARRVSEAADVRQWGPEW